LEKQDTEDEYLGVGGGTGTGSRSNSISSFQSIHSAMHSDSNVASERSVKRTNSRPPIPAHMLNTQTASSSNGGEKHTEKTVD
uniref:F102A protein n=1 Tax=Anisakis simplex TaxID=6269 RepID=A0A0M3JHC5_ANISI